MELVIETEIEVDGRWIADVVAIPGCMAYGVTESEAIANVQALALRVIADQIEHGEATPFRSVVFIAHESVPCDQGTRGATRA